MAYHECPCTVINDLRAMLVNKLIETSCKVCSLDEKNDKLRNDNTTLIIDVFLSFMDACSFSIYDQHTVILFSQDYFVDGEIRSHLINKCKELKEDAKRIENETRAKIYEPCTDPELLEIFKD